MAAHKLDRTCGNSGGRTTPTRVNCGDDVMHRVGKQYRRAVRHLANEHDSRPVGDKTVGALEKSPSVLLGDISYVRRMHLPAAHGVGKGVTDVGEQYIKVFFDIFGVISAIFAEIH